MATFTFTGYRWTGTYYGSPSTPEVTIEITDNDGTMDWFGGDSDQTATTSDGLATNGSISGGSLLKVRMDFGSDGSEDTIENVAFFYVDGGGWYFIPLPGSDFETGDTLLGNDGTGWTEPGVGWEYSDVICFTDGAMLSTPLGPRPVQSLAAGDLVITQDHGLQPIRWIGCKRVSGARLYARENLRPVLIRRGALGDGLPDQDLHVSPNHRILHRSARASLYHGNTTVLVPAKGLIDLPGVEIDNSLQQTTYWHLLFDRHQVIWSNGQPVESFHPGEVALGTVEAAAREEIFTLFPELRSMPETYGPTARLSLSPKQTRALVAA